MEKTINCFTNIAPLYRKKLWLALLEKYESNIFFYFGEEVPQNIKLIDVTIPSFAAFRPQFIKIRNYWLFKKLLVWQTNVIWTCLKQHNSINIFYGNMYCLSTWIAAIICRLKGLPVIFWSHGIYGNEGRLKLFFRKVFYKLAQKHLLYERRAKKIMVEKGFKRDNLYVVFNSLDYQKHKRLRNKFSNSTRNEFSSFFKRPELPTLIFIGRLTPIKKLHYLISAVSEINHTTPILNLLIVGDGPTSKDLITQGELGVYGKWLYFD